MKGVVPCFLIGAVVSIGLGVVVESLRHVFFPVGLGVLVFGFIAEKLTQRTPGKDLSAMREVREEWVAFSIRSREIRLSDRWNLSRGITVPGVPDELSVTVIFLKDEHFKIVKSIELTGRATHEANGKAKIAVDSGWIYIGDARLLASGISAKKLGKLIDSAFDRVNDQMPLMLVVPDPDGKNCGVVAASGLGDGSYAATWRCDGQTWRLYVSFL